MINAAPTKNMIPTEKRRTPENKSRSNEIQECHRKFTLLQYTHPS